MSIESSDSLSQKTFPELAQEALTNSDPEKFIHSLKPIDDDYILELTLFYFQALGSIMAKLYTRREKAVPRYSMEQMDIFNKNKSTLEAVLIEIEELSLNQLLAKYNEAVIISGLVYLIRQWEASIKKYDKYLNLKEKFFSWAKIGIKSIRVIEAWKDFTYSLTELEEWLLDKKQFYLKPVEAMINEFEINPDVNSERFYEIMKKFISEDKEIFYGIANILISNPLLNRDILDLSQMDEPNYLRFEKLIYGILVNLNQENYNAMLKNMIGLFTKQIRYERPDIFSY